MSHANDQSQGLLLRGLTVIGTALLAVGMLFQPLNSYAEQVGPFAAVNVDANLARYTPQTQVSGSFKVRGSDTMYPLVTRLALEFQRRQPKVTFDIRGGGSTEAIAKFLEPPPSKVGNVVVIDERSFPPLISTSRELFDAETKEFVAQHGYEPLAVPVAVDAVALYVHKDNPLQGVTLDQVDAMFSTTRNRGHKTGITQWGQLGLTDGWEKAKIELYGRDRKSGTRAFFQEHSLAGGEFMPGLHEEPGAASVILDLGRNQTGIGYSGYGLQSSNVRILPLAEAEGMPFVTPTATTIADQTYPLRRVLYLYLDKNPKKPLPDVVKEFLAFIMSHEGQEAVIKAGFFPLPANQMAKTAVALGNASTSRSIRR
ncbi:MAG TPA: PstS family phosphate ABC transporter substrate-binding protein [Nitrospira sp.]|nr:PstS family phosphate ABC transporter substrate-binding protein [Nitrospira sp.]